LRLLHRRTAACQPGTRGTLRRSAKWRLHRTGWSCLLALASTLKRGRQHRPDDGIRRP
jgi:hypothetical protein